MTPPGWIYAAGVLLSGASASTPPTCSDPTVVYRNCPAGEDWTPCCSESYKFYDGSTTELRPIVHDQSSATCRINWNADRCHWQLQMKGTPYVAPVVNPARVCNDRPAEVNFLFGYGRETQVPSTCSGQGCEGQYDAHICQKLAAAGYCKSGTASTSSTTGSDLFTFLCPESCGLAVDTTICQQSAKRNAAAAELATTLKHRSLGNLNACQSESCYLSNATATDSVFSYICNMNAPHADCSKHSTTRRLAAGDVPALMLAEFGDVAARKLTSSQWFTMLTYGESSTGGCVRNKGLLLQREYISAS